MQESAGEREAYRGRLSNLINLSKNHLVADMIRNRARSLIRNPVLDSRLGPDLDRIHVQHVEETPGY